MLYLLLPLPEGYTEGEGRLNSAPKDCRFVDDFCEGRVLGGVEEPLAVLSVEVDLFDASMPFAESLELFEDFSVLKLLFDNRRRS
jgi:hypothetical protein